MDTILIVDDELNIREGLKAVLKKSEYKILTAADGLSALAILKSEPVDLLISDIRMPKMDGITLQEEALKLNPHLPVILLTAYGSIETAVEAMRKGAYDFLTKPINLDKFELVTARALERKKLGEENQVLKKELHKKQDIVGNSRVMQVFLKKMKAIAETKSTVLIYGESGTGKELVASAIHRLSPRRDQPFVAVNCSALSESLLESELFGHEKGAFTGALFRKDGRFKLSDKGTLFLDEVGDLPQKVQIKLLRVLQEKTFEPVGSNHSITVDVRFITATNKNLKQLVEKGEFREDLYYRLDVIKLTLPPLRDRKDDIPLLTDYFLKQFCEEMNRHPKSLSRDALKILTEYPWPGNVRELKNTIENLVIFSSKDVIETNEIPETILHREKTPSASLASPDNMNLVENEKKLILRALEECRYNKTAAAEKLGMSRRTIHRKIKEFGLEA
ncbi:MAG: sigma-54-dependent Fis family transcriptional regulator [Candidatus Aureabacteria bacterium]|nr:sigma-54-dependent Fis family transcriptional regulator [Candidatus Auribacterota bacterium]